MRPTGRGTDDGQTAHNDLARCVVTLPAQHAAPEARQAKRVVRIEANRQELTSHPATHL